ncbi:MAG: SH3 domain-containing protein [Deltaproteobacteria bacterium]|nr:SH3 domain-containing protein [Deltaproteobacteria bacterium]
MSYFEKAHSLAPNDDDVAYNLKLVQSIAEKAGTLTRDQNYWTGHIVPLVRRVPESAVDFLFAIASVALGWTAYSAKKRGRRFLKAFQQPGFLTVAGVWAAAAALTVTIAFGHQTKLAAIVADVGVGRSGPSDTFTELFKVPAGTTVELTGENREGWRQIRFSLGNVGWIMEKDLLPL